MGAKLTKQLDAPQDVVNLRLQAPDMVVEITLPLSTPRIIEKIPGRLPERTCPEPAEGTSRTVWE